MKFMLKLKLTDFNLCVYEVIVGCETPIRLYLVWFFYGVAVFVDHCFLYKEELLCTYSIRVKLLDYVL